MMLLKCAKPYYFYEWTPSYENCSVQLDIKFILLINVKMPAIVDILALIYFSRINKYNIWKF